MLLLFTFPVATPFESFAECPIFQTPPPTIAEEILAVLTAPASFIFTLYDPPFLKERREQEAREMQERWRNFLYRLAFPKDKLSYWEAWALAQRGHDNFLFKCIRLLPREVEQTSWFADRHAAAEERNDRRFFQRYGEALANPSDLTRQFDQQAACRLLWLAILEPELRGSPP